MPLSVEGINIQINCRTANTSILPICTMAKLAKAAEATTQASNSRCHWVSTCVSLPAPSCATGAFYYIQDQCLYVYSNGSSWQDDYGITVNERRLYTWGLNNCGQLGANNLTTTCTINQTLCQGKNWSKVAASAGNHIVATKTDGSIWAWGQNTCGQIGDGTTINRSSPTCLVGFGNFTQLSSGQCHSVGLDFAGKILAWGYNGLGQLGTNNTITRTSPVREITASSNWKWVSAGCDHTLAIKSDGTLWTWGSNVCGVLGTNNTINRSSPGTVAGGGTTWYTVSSEWNHNLAVKTDGTLWTWGSNTCGQLGTGNAINRSSPGTVAGCGTNWCNISAGNCFSTAIKSDGTLWTWGINTCGQLGDGTVITKLSPVTIAGGGTTWFEVVGGCAHSLAKKTDGSLWSWGHNNCGQLGDQTLINRSSPVTVVSANTNWTEVSAGAGYSVGVQVTITIP